MKKLHFITKITKLLIICTMLLNPEAADNRTSIPLPKEQQKPPPATTATAFRSVSSEATEAEDTTTDVVTKAGPVRHSFARFPLPPFHPDSRYGPYFEDGDETINITARLGSTVLLNCTIGLLQDKTVTWLHHRDDSIHLLTVGRNGYSSDERITLSYRYPNNYRLQIVYVTKRDQGMYECQVATHPPKIRKINLRVIAPEVRIVDESGREVTERYYKAGSGLELTCIAKRLGGPDQNSPVAWKHGDRTLSKGISYNLSIETDSVTSSLTVAPLEKHDSGNYTCAVGNLAIATVAVHVLNGELPAAVHHGNAAFSVAPRAYLLVAMIGLVLLAGQR